MRTATRLLTAMAAGLATVLVLLVMVSCTAPSDSPAAGPFRPDLPAAGVPTGFVAPASFDVPALKITGSSLMPLGLNPDGTVAVPPLNQPRQAGYWVPSAPTAMTPTVILAHINARGFGPGLFAHLSSLKPGDTVTVHRAGGASATFTITRVYQVSKEKFPTEAVYADQATPTLRLVTCGGDYDAAAHSYLDNIIADGVPA